VYLYFLLWNNNFYRRRRKKSIFPEKRCFFFYQISFCIFTVKEKEAKYSPKAENRGKHNVKSLFLAISRNLHQQFVRSKGNSEYVA